MQRGRSAHQPKGSYRVPGTSKQLQMLVLLGSTQAIPLSRAETVSGVAARARVSVPALFPGFSETDRIA